jgi:hypothetical protein
MDKAVFGLVRSRDQAEVLVNELMRSGFKNEEISVLFSDSRHAEDATAVSNKGLGTEKHTKASEGAAAGGTIGGLIGGTLGLLAGIGALAIPGMGPFIAAGPIMAAIAGSGLGGGIGLLTGSLVGLGIPEYEAVHYAERLKDGNHILISVHTRSSEAVDQAKKIFKKNGALDISSTRESTSSKR